MTGTTTSSQIPSTLHEVTEETFTQDVLQASQDKPIIVDFWADWCGPCKQLTPVLEKVMKTAKGHVALVGVDIEKNASLAAQLLHLGLPLQSIPLVAAFFEGQVIDLFQGVRSESEIRDFLSTVMKRAKLGPLPADELILRGNTLLESGEPEKAQKVFGLVLDEDPKSAGAWAGIVSALIAVDDEAAARAALADIPQELRDQPEIKSVATALDLKSKGRASAENLEDIKARLSRDPHDHQAQYDMALLLNSSGKKREAIDLLIDILKADKTWKDGAAHEQLLQFFEAWGAVDPDTIYGRRALSSVLFS